VFDAPGMRNPAVIDKVAARQGGTSMAETGSLADREAIRDWRAARIGAPAIVDRSAQPGTQRRPTAHPAATELRETDRFQGLFDHK
jgi:hypothetical protein